MARRSGIRPVIQSFKQVRYDAPASIAAAAQTTYTLSNGVDNYTGPSASNNECPTGSIIKNFNIQLCNQNLVNVAAFLVVTLQLNRSGQSPIDGLAVGGNAQRNQIHKTIYRSVGMNQNANININFKIPKKYQRVREGDRWHLVTACSAIHTESVYTIYKFYR